MSEERQGLLSTKERDEDDSTTERSRVVFNGDSSVSFASRHSDNHYYSRDPLHVPFSVRILISLGLFRLIPKSITFKLLVYVLTFIAYATYHMSRKPFSVVKVVLNPPTNINDSLHNGWSPFNHHDGKTLLGGVDNAWGFSYAFAMFFSGIIADRVNLRYFLTMGMLGSAIATMLLGVPYYAGIHLYSYFILVQIFGGVMQSTGWPSVVSIMSHWFGKQRRGLLMGIWNAHTSVGNIVGTIIPSFWANPTSSHPNPPWGLSFIVPSLIMAGVAMLVFSLLVVDPQYVGVSPPVHTLVSTRQSDTEASENKSVGGGNGVHSSTNSDPSGASLSSQPKAVGFFKALMIPGVAEYSLALFFNKLVSYTFLFWLPYYVQTSYEELSSEQSDWLSTLFDVGGIIGGIATGLLSDVLNARALSCVLSLILAVPSLFLLRFIGDAHISVYIILLIVSGIFINGPYAIITTAVSSDLGTHPSLKNNQNAKATVTAIIDGTGSIGAALGPLLIGWLSTTSISWDGVFYTLMLSCFLSAVFMLRLLVTEVLECIKHRRSHQHPVDCGVTFPMMSCRS